MGTASKGVRGMVFDGEGLRKATLTIRFTSDKYGESVSIADDKTIMLSVPFDEIEKVKKRARDYEERW